MAVGTDRRSELEVAWRRSGGVGVAVGDRFTFVTEGGDRRGYTVAAVGEIVSLLREDSTVAPEEIPDLLHDRPGLFAQVTERWLLEGPGPRPHWVEAEA
jgi:hypothetical protein